MWAGTYGYEDEETGMGGMALGAFSCAGTPPPFSPAPAPLPRPRLRRRPPRSRTKGADLCSCPDCSAPRSRHREGQGPNRVGLISFSHATYRAVAHNPNIRRSKDMFIMSNMSRLPWGVIPEVSFVAGPDSGKEGGDEGCHLAALLVSRCPPRPAPWRRACRPRC